MTKLEIYGYQEYAKGLMNLASTMSKWIGPSFVDAYCYTHRDFDLKEGETTTDLHMKEMEKFNNLYKEMLDFIHVKYNKD
ncbi:MAG: hypothetical protein IKG53_09990, partial [Solobacterium sp.]|nr:hypothetical protein [Solobacterium sp.]